MNAELLSALHAADEVAIMRALQELESSTKSCSLQQLEQLRIAGVLPNGVFDYLKAIRVKI